MHAFRSLRLPHTADQTRANLTRVRLRAAIQGCLPGAAWAFFSLLLVFALTWVTRLLIQAWRHMLCNVEFCGVKLFAPGS